MYTFYLALYGYYFTKTELFGEWCAVTFNEVNENVKADLFIIRCDLYAFHHLLNIVQIEQNTCM